MSDSTMNVKRFRSPPYPYLTLAKSIERSARLFQKAQHHPVGIKVLADAWGMSPQSGSLLKSVAALIQYGLVKDQGSGDGRKFQLTDAARRILQDADPASERRSSLVKAAALAPNIHKELWEKFGSPANLSDALLKNHLLFDRTEVGEAPFSDNSADEVIQTYRDAVAYAQLDDIENVTEQPPLDDLTSLGSSRSAPMLVTLGDFVQWEVSGVFQFNHPRKVRWISDDGEWVAVEGSDAGIPAAEVILEQKNMSAPRIPREEQETRTIQSEPNDSPGYNEWFRSAVGLKTFVSIRVDGTMGPREIGKLIKLLEVQKDILQEE